MKVRTSDQQMQQFTQDVESAISTMTGRINALKQENDQLRQRIAQLELAQS